MTLRLVRGGTDQQSPPREISSQPRITIELSELLVAYDSLFALNCPRASFSGNVIAVLGHNGAGKSTLLKALLGLLPLRSGEIALSMSHKSETFPLYPEQHIAFCPESGAVFADISVENYIKLWCRIRHRNPRYYLEEGSRYIELLSLGPLLHKLGRELSKGQRRRVQTAIGFFMQPSLFLLDEPFDGLDVQKTHELAEIIEDHSHRMSFIISSHRMDVIERLADTIVVLDQGQVFAHGGVEQVSVVLAGKNLSLVIPHGVDKATKLLKEHFPALLVTHIGNQVSVTGEELNESLVKEVLAAANIAISHTDTSRPTLVDAMNYHLRKISLPSKR